MILRSTLDAEMKDATRAGVALQNKKAEKFFFFFFFFSLFHSSQIQQLQHK